MRRKKPRVDLRTAGKNPVTHMRRVVQGPNKWFVKCDMHYPCRSGQTSLATAEANFTKLRTSHSFDLCTILQCSVSSSLARNVMKTLCDRRDQTSETVSEKVKFEKLVLGESVDPADDETSGPRRDRLIHGPQVVRMAILGRSGKQQQ